MMFVTQYVCDFIKFILKRLVNWNILTNLNENYSQLNDEKTKSKSSWSERWRKLRMLWSFIWPQMNFEIQVRMFICILIVFAESSVNIVVPLYNQKIVDSLDKKLFCWDLILIYAGVKFLSMGPMWSLRAYLWDRVEQFLDGNTEVKLFAHLHSLSLRWHLSRKSSEVLDTMYTAKWTISRLVSFGLFEIGPSALNILTSIIYLTAAFNWYFGILIIITLIVYLYMRIYVTNWADGYRDQMKLSQNEQHAVGVDSLLNIETVKYCGTAKFEIESYRKATVESQKESHHSNVAYYVTDLVENVIICGSLLIGSLLCAYLVADVGSLTSGQYIFFSAYILQLFSPVNQLSGIYLHIKTQLVDMEKLFDILNESPEVVDAPDAVELTNTQGDVKFSNVNFSYGPDRAVLKNISFSVSPGKTIALVGPSGSGKSTIIRLLSRFYDVDSGFICVDGLNVKKIKQESLHSVLGIVPQDTCLFNKTIKYNIKYGRLSATDEEVESAAIAADIHEQITSFPDKYETEVGDKGLRLSGGEKQRVAIARTILKAPPIVLLDEATSALDTKTERNIQAALSNVCKNRTTIIVAHRLSTVIHADEILVLKQGEIIERGKHKALLEQKGIYADMWTQQLENDSVPSNEEELGEHEKLD